MPLSLLLLADAAELVLAPEAPAITRVTLFTPYEELFTQQRTADPDNLDFYCRVRVESLLAPSEVLAFAGESSLYCHTNPWGNDSWSAWPPPSRRASRRTREADA